MKKLISMLAATLIASTIGISVMAESHAFAPAMSIGLSEITGRISDQRGNPVAALKISLRNWFGSDLVSAVSLVVAERHFSLFCSPPTGDMLCQ
jgi:hypothetical protein